MTKAFKKNPQASALIGDHEKDVPSAVATTTTRRTDVALLKDPESAHNDNSESQLSDVDLLTTIARHQRQMAASDSEATLLTRQHHLFGCNQSNPLDFTGDNHGSKNDKDDDDGGDDNYSTKDVILREKEICAIREEAISASGKSNHNVSDATESRGLVEPDQPEHLPTVLLATLDPSPPLQGLQRNVGRYGLGTPGAFAVPGVGQVNPPHQSGNDDAAPTSVDDVESPPLPASNNNSTSSTQTQEQDGGDVLLVEARLVDMDVSSSPAFSGSNDLDLHDYPNQRPILAHASPLQEKEKKSLSWRELLTNHRVWTMLGIVVLVVTVALGVSVGMTRGAKNENDVTTNQSGSPTTTSDSSSNTSVFLFDDGLPQATIDAILHEPDSPQARANRWMLEDENHTAYSRSRQLQRFGLVVFFYATGGENWRNPDQWLNHSVNECSWGLYFDVGDLFESTDDYINEQGPEIVYGGYYERSWHLHYGSDSAPKDSSLLACSNGDNVYHTILLASNNLDGYLPEELFLFLPELTYLVLAHNPLLTSTIPSAIGVLSSLEEIILDGSSISGTLPTEIGNLQSLYMLDFYRNQLTGRLPTEMGLLTSLEFMFLGLNRLDGPLISELGKLETLVVLGLESNELTGSISGEIFREQSLLKVLTLGDNFFSSTIPSEIKNAENLVELSFWDCLLTGSLPGLSPFIQLVKLEMDGNSLTGTLSTEIGLMRNLELLALSGNVLRGSLPSEIGNLFRLSDVYLQANELSGSLPSELGRLKSLVLLDLGENEFIHGTIPSELALLESLQKLYLDETGLTGFAPEALCELEASGELLNFQLDCSSVVCCQEEST